MKVDLAKQELEALLVLCQEKVSILNSDYESEEDGVEKIATQFELENFISILDKLKVAKILMNDKKRGNDYCY